MTEQEEQELDTAIFVLLGQFEEAVGEILNWSYYASDYFREKHDAEGTAANYMNIIQSFRNRQLMKKYKRG